MARIKGASDYVDPHLSFDSMSGFVTHYDDMSVEYNNDISVFEYSPVLFHFHMIASLTPITHIYNIDDVGGPNDSLSGQLGYDYDLEEKKVTPVSSDIKSVDFGTLE